MKKQGNGSRQAPVAVFADKSRLLDFVELTRVLRSPERANKLPLEINHIGLPKQAE
jgi:hypothetical protein